MGYFAQLIYKIRVAEGRKMGNCSFFLKRSEVIIGDPGRPVDLLGESATGREHPHGRVKPAGRHHDQENQD
jgi:hypothetical protein